MRFEETPIAGAWIVEPEPARDERGFFARTFCVDEFRAHGIDVAWLQHSVSYNARAGTLRGLHYQAPPFPESKLVSCARGAIVDVIVDLRPASPSYRRWIAVELSAANRRALYVPPMVAHGFQTLVDDTELVYLISERYRPELARGVRWDDPALGVRWPDCAHRIVSARDASFPDLEPA